MGPDMTLLPTIEPTLFSLPESVREHSAAAQVRLTLPERTRSTTLDGAWWPHSTNLADELPALIAELYRRDFRITRVSYHPELWGPEARRLRADGRVIRLGWFRSTDRHLVSLTGRDGSDRVDLLVVPPDTPSATAARAMQAVGGRTRSTATAVLAAAGALPDVVASGAAAVPRPRYADSEADLRETTSWESEGGHLERETRDVGGSSPLTHRTVMLLR
jgi:hypothetical protein